MIPDQVTQEEITSLLDEAQTQEHTFWGKELVVSYKLPCGFTISGSGVCADPAKFSLEVGRQLARKDAEKQLWQLEVYRKQLDAASMALFAKVAEENSRNTELL